MSTWSKMGEMAAELMGAADLYSLSTSNDWMGAEGEEEEEEGQVLVGLGSTHAHHTYT